MFADAETDADKFKVIQRVIEVTRCPEGSAFIPIRTNVGCLNCEIGYTSLIPIRTNV